MAAIDDRPDAVCDLSTPEGFERLVLASQARLRRFLLRKGVPAQEAQELCQDAFLTLWQNRHKPRNPRTFLMGIANRLALAYHRKRDRLPTVCLDEAPAGVQAVAIAGPSPASGLPADSGRTATLTALLKRLTLRQRQVVDMVWLQEVPRRAAAGQLGISEGALRFHEKRALDRLRSARSS